MHNVRREPTAPSTRSMLGAVGSMELLGRMRATKAPFVATDALELACNGAAHPRYVLRAIVSSRSSILLTRAKPVLRTQPPHSPRLQQWQEGEDALQPQARLGVREQHHCHQETQQLLAARELPAQPRTGQTELQWRRTVSALASATW